MGVRKVYYNWNDINKLLDKLYDQVKGKVSLVTGIPRGGTILAILFSHRFDIPYTKYPSNHYPEMLIIDDIADSGVTLEEWKQEFTVPKFATLHYKTISKVKPDFYVKEIDENYGWVVYPWEKENSKSIQDYLEN
jgi:hypoxanthine phosphoribosyltransferase